MRIASLTLENFKRFTSLEIGDLPETAKLVLLIGSNGAGKSSIFDALNILGSGEHSTVQHVKYHQKVSDKSFRVEAKFHPSGHIVWESGHRSSTLKELPRFFGRSSLRVVPNIQIVSDAASRIEKNSDRPRLFTHEDRRFFADVTQFTSQIDRALREPTFQGQQADTVAIFRSFIEPFNQSLLRIFGENDTTTIQLKSFENSDPQRPIRLFFTKGSSTVPFDFLSYGEKQVITLLLNFVVRRDHYTDAVCFIDEMDLHLNTALQKNVLREIVEQWIPDGAQLWTASHALGFIEYADESDRAVIIDFDDLDFDLPQRLVPTPWRQLDVFEIAVPRDSLARLFSGRKVIACEGNDGALYNAACDDDSRLFIPAGNAEQVFGMVQTNPNLWGIRDRDYLLPSEIEQLRRLYPNYYILPCYSIENLLYHPDNIESLNITGYDAQVWRDTIRAAKDHRPLRDVKYARGKIRELRAVPIFQNKRAWEVDAEELYQAYQSRDFDIFYPVVPMKEMPHTYLVPFGISEGKLARAPWMVRKLKEITT